MRPPDLSQLSHTQVERVNKTAQDLARDLRERASRAKAEIIAHYVAQNGAA